MKMTTDKNKTATRSLRNLDALKNKETWYQDLEDGNLWHGTHGVILNTAALIEREFFYNIQRVPAQKPARRPRLIVAYA
ncbi:MAG: hypothetical protein ACRCYY_18625 [Trueperaceae bacterium]